MAIVIAFHIPDLKFYQGEHRERGKESVCRTADLFFVILWFTAKAVPSNDYKEKKKKINSRNQRIQNK